MIKININSLSKNELKQKKLTNKKKSKTKNPMTNIKKSWVSYKRNLGACTHLSFFFLYKNIFKKKYKLQVGL